MFDFLHHLFLPRESNNHRAKLLHHENILLAIILLFLTQFVLVNTQNTFPSVLGVSISFTVDQLLALTNQQRQANGLQPLTLDSELTNAATAKGADMFAKNYWAHNAPDGTTPWYFIKSAGYDYTYAGENLARGYFSASDVVNAWMASPGHRANILSPNYHDIGFSIQSGMLTGDDTILVVQEFGSRALAQAPTTQTVAVVPSPTIAITPATHVPVAVVTQIPTSTPLPTTVPVTPTMIPRHVVVAAAQTEPLFNRTITIRTLAMGVIGLFIFVLCLDMIIIQRKRIVRVFEHNLDHILYLSIILVIIFMITRGAIL